jgi:hypothetical protein
MDKIQVKSLKKAKEIKDKKSKRVHLVVTESEYQQILSYSSEFKTVSDYIRESCLFNNERPFNKTKELTKTMNSLTKEMKAVGKNINQAAKYTNFLLENRLSFDSINRFNKNIIRYTAMQMKFEQLLKKVFNN